MANNFETKELAQAKHFDAKAGLAGAATFAVVVATLLGTGWSVWAWVR